MAEGRITSESGSKAAPIRCELGFYETTNVVRGIYASPTDEDSRRGTVPVGATVCAKAFVNGRNYVLDNETSSRWLRIQAQGIIQYIPGIFVRPTEVDDQDPGDF